MASPSRELLLAARHLIDSDPLPAAQVSRAVSTAYYTIFEHVCSAASELLIGGNSEQYLTRAKGHLRRSIGHKALVARCRSAQNEKYGFPEKIIKFANRLFATYEKRIKADYDTYSTFTKLEAETIINEVENAIGLFDSTQKKHRIAFIVWAIIEKPKHD